MLIQLLLWSVRPLLFVGAIVLFGHSLVRFEIVASPSQTYWNTIIIGAMFIVIALRSLKMRFFSAEKSLGISLRRGFDDGH